ncbi:MAG: DNA polymerase III subunit alpha [Bacteroidia bacterium]
MYLIFDTETTGLPRDYNAPVTDTDNWPRMVQMAWQLHDEKGQLLEVKNFIVQPEGYTIPFNAVKVHKISTERAMAEGVPLDFVLHELNRVLQTTTHIAGHNIGFDISVVGAEFVRKGIETHLLQLASVDTKDESTDYCALAGGKGGKFKWPTLTELHQKLFGEPFNEAHNASADVEATARCFLELIRLGVISATRVGLEGDKLAEYQSANPSVIDAIGLNTQPYKPLSDQAEQTSDALQIPSEVLASETDIRGFVHLHCHTQFSLTPGTSGVEDLVNHAKSEGSMAIAMTDHGNLYGAFAFVNAAFKAGVKPIIGAEFNVCRDMHDKKNKDNGYGTVFLAKNKIGYHNLVKLASHAFLDGYYYMPRIDKELLVQYKDELIVTTGSLYGEVPSLILNVGETQAEEAFLWWKEQFGENFYVELQRHGLEEEDHVNEILLGWAQKYDVKYIASNNTYYTTTEDADTHDTLLCIIDQEVKSTPIGKGRGYRFGFANNKYYLRTQQEMATLFADLPEALNNTVLIADQIEAFELKREVLLPRYDIPEGFADQDDYLRHLTYEGAKKRYGTVNQEISTRLDFELETIKRTGYPGYFLIVQDFTTKAREMGVSVGPGRGSAAGSAVAYCIGITNVDPIHYDLLFERFLNPDRVSMPDIDIDFDDRGRSKVMRYVIDKYGEKQVAQIITYGTLAAKSAIRNAARVLELPLAEADVLAKAFPEAIIGIKAFSKSPMRNLVFKPHLLDEHKKDLQPEEYQAAQQFLKMVQGDNLTGRVLRQAGALEGAIRTTGTHACGVIITPDDITNFVPVKLAQDAEIKLVTQFDNDVAESAGLLKMDFLGLSTLTIINDAIEIIRERHGITIDPDAIPLDDPKTYELFQKGDTVGIFQYESPGMQKYMKELKPDKFDDLIAMNALYRPGPLQYIPNFIARKHGQEPISYDLDAMEEYLKDTYGITVYQEQVMLLSQKLAGFTKGQADELRKAMGKKIKEKLDKMKPMFLEGCSSNGHDTKVAEKVWADWEKFAAYAFNKSHSTCYAVVAFQTAYLKANYPAEFMAAVLSNNLNDIGKVTFFMEECRRMGVDVLGPEINESAYRFTVNEQNQIRFGLGGIKGVGEGAVEAIVNERNSNGHYRTIFDLCKRVDLRQANKKTLEGLAQAGAFDNFEGIAGNRRVFFDNSVDGTTLLEKAIRFGNQYQNLKLQSQASLFGEAGVTDIPEPEIVPCEPWPLLEKLQKEKEVVGIFITAHPLDAFKYDIQKFCNVGLRHIEDVVGRDLTFAGLVTDVQYFQDPRTNNETIVFIVEDYDTVRKLRLKGEQAMRYKHLITVGTGLLFKGKYESFVNKEGKEFKYLRINSVDLLADVREKHFKQITIRLRSQDVQPALLSQMASLFKEFEGKVKLQVLLIDEEEKMQVEFTSKSIRLNPENALLEALEKMPLLVELSD